MASFQLSLGMEPYFMFRTFIEVGTQWVTRKISDSRRVSDRTAPMSLPANEIHETM